MKTVRVIAWILAWFNLVFWGIPIITSIMQSLARPNPLILVMLVFLAAIPLNSFAALQLHRSIRNPKIPLGHHTPVGIRFVGIFALVVGGIITCCGILLLQHAQEFFPTFKEQWDGLKQGAPITVDNLRQIGIFFLVLGVAEVINVVLNTRLLRWYYLTRPDDQS
jgi:hypothetical protein